LKPQATTSYDDITAILQTSLHGHADVVAELLAARADVNVRRSDPGIMDCGATALLLAAKRGHSETVKLLLRGRCDVNASNVNAEGALYGAASNNRPDTLQLLLARADLHQRCEYGEIPTALHAAAKRDFQEVAQLLVLAGADLTSTSPAGQVPLDLATSQGMREILGVGTKKAKSDTHD